MDACGVFSQVLRLKVTVGLHDRIPLMEQLALDLWTSASWAKVAGAQWLEERERVWCV